MPYTNYHHHHRNNTTRFFTDWTWQHARVRPFSIEAVRRQGRIMNTKYVPWWRMSLMSPLRRWWVHQQGIQQWTWRCGTQTRVSIESNSSIQHCRRIIRRVLTPMVKRATAWFTLRRGDTSTAWRRTVPWEPIRVESSRGPVLTMASTRT